MADYRKESAIDRDDRLDYGYTKGGAIAEKATVFVEERTKEQGVRSGYSFQAGRGKDPFSEEEPIWVDAASLVWWAFHHSGIDLRGGSEGMSVWTIERDLRLRTVFGYGQKSSQLFKSMKRGDLVWFNTCGRNTHIGIYTGRGRFISCSGSGSKKEGPNAGIIEQSMAGGPWLKSFRGLVKRLE